MLHDSVSACLGIGEKVMVSPKSITCQAKAPDNESDQAAYGTHQGMESSHGTMTPNHGSHQDVSV